MVIIDSFKNFLFNESNNPPFHPYGGNTKKLWWDRFDEHTLTKISKGGSDREVYDFGNPKMVLKVAKTARGLLQNDAELDGYLQGELLPEWFEYGENYIVTEKVSYNNKPLINKFVKDLSEIRPYVYNLHKGDNHSKVLDIIESVSENYNVKKLEGLLEYDNVLWGDILAARNWGIGTDGRIVLADGASISSDWLKVPHDVKQTWKSFLASKREYEKQKGVKP